MDGVNEDGHRAYQCAAALEFQKVQPALVLPPKGADYQGGQQALDEATAASEYYDERGLLRLRQHYLQHAKKIGEQGDSPLVAENFFCK